MGRVLARSIEVTAGAIFCLILILSLLEVISRYFTGHSLVWVVELNRFLFIWLVFLAAAACFYRRLHAGSNEKVFAAVDGEFGKRLNAAMEEAGFKILAWWDAAPRHFLNNRRPINTPDDMKGLKMRVQESPVWVKSMTALGAIPVALDFKELFSALQQNVIDGYEGIATDVDKQSMYQVAKYMSLSSHLFDVFGVYINKRPYEGLTSEQQRMLNEAMKTATAWQRRTQAADVAESQSKLRSLMQVNEISPANRKLFADRVRPVYRDFERDLGKELINEAIKALS